MHAGKAFPFVGFIHWTRWDIYKLLVLVTVPMVLYHVFGLTFLSITWEPVALLGTAVSFIIGFKNNASYARLWEARTIYGGILNASRAFSVMVRDFLPPEQSDAVRTIFNRYFAWLTALRYVIRCLQPCGLRR